MYVKDMYASLFVTSTMRKVPCSLVYSESTVLSVCVLCVCVLCVHCTYIGEQALWFSLQCQ